MKFLLSLLAVLALVTGCSRHVEDREVSSLPAAKVRLGLVEAEVSPALLSVPGTVRPQARAVLSAKVSGAISEIPVALGQKVKAGEVLVRLFSEDVRARVTQAQAALSTTQRDYDRERELQVKGASTAEMVRALADRLVSAEAQLREAEVQLGFGELRAPFAGVVVAKPVHEGEFAGAGQPLLEIEGEGALEIEAALPESLAPAVTLGTALTIQGTTGNFLAVVREKSATADAANRSVSVKLTVPPEGQVRSGQWVSVGVPGTPVSHLWISEEALSRVGQMERVFVVTASGTAELRLVRSGGSRQGRVEILSGLNARERVVLQPPAGLVDGQALEVIP